MSIVYWGRGSDAFKACLSSQRDPTCRPETFHEDHSIEALRTSLAAHSADLQLAVLAPASTDELTALLALTPLFCGVPVIVLLPTDDVETSALAHRFHPRFASVFDGNMENAAAVAANILRIREKCQ